MHYGFLGRGSGGTSLSLPLAGGPQRLENDPVDHFQRRPGGSPVWWPVGPDEVIQREVPPERSRTLQIQVLLKIAGVGLLVTVICQALTKAGREDIATVATVAGILIVVMMVVNLAGDVLAQVQAVFQLP